MSTVIDTDLLVLHGLAVKKAGSPESLAAIIGIDPDQAEQALVAAQEAGRAMGAKGTYMLTPAGRAWLDEQYPVACAELRTNDEFVGAYERFEVINRQILDLFTRWQTVKVGGTAVPNDHTDEDYDNKITDELGDIHEQAVPVLNGFSAADARFSIYGDRFESAYDRVLAGDKDWVSGARIDSYHTVWFELHEDILRMLGRTRPES